MRSRTDLSELWRFNLGTGFNAPLMNNEVNRKQHIAIASGLCWVRPSGQFATMPHQPHIGDADAVRMQRCCSPSVYN